MQRETINYDIDFDLDGNEVWLTATFDIEVEEFELEPTAWGTGRGTEAAVFASLKSIRMGNLTASGELMLEIFGAKQIDRAEAAACERYYEENY